MQKTLALSAQPPNRVSAQKIPHPRRRFHWRALLCAICAILALEAMIVSAHLLRPNEWTVNEGFASFVIGLVFAGIALALKREAVSPPPQKTPDRPIAWSKVALGFVLLALLTQINALSEASRDSLALIWYISHHVQVILFVGGTGLVTWGVCGAPRWRWPSWQLGWHHGALAVIILVGLIARVVNLEYGIHRFLDEMHYANAVANLWYGGPQKILQPFTRDVTSFTWLFPYLQSWTAWLTGPSLTGLRLVGVIFGMAQILAIYALGKELAGRAVGVLAALFLATFPPHIHFSRIGINNIADPLFGMLAFLYVLRGFRTGARADYALVGLFIGLTQYFYEGGRLFYPPFIICWLGWMALFGRRDSFQLPTWRNLLACGGVAAALFLPMYFVWGVGGFPMLPRYDAVGLDGAEIAWRAANIGLNPLELMWHNIRAPLLGFVHLPESGWFYGGRYGFILTPLVPFFLLGLAFVYWRMGRPAGALLFWWFIGVAAANSLIRDNLSSPRYLVVFPCVALLFAVGVWWLTQIVLPQAMSWRWRWAIIALMVLPLVAYQYHYYLTDHLPNFYRAQYYDEKDRFGVRVKDVEDALFRAMTLPDDTDVHILSRGVIWGPNLPKMVAYYGRTDEIRIAYMQPSEFDQDYIDQLPPDRHHAFFIEPQDAASYNLIAANFTLGLPQFSPYDIPPDRQFILYFADRADNYRRRATSAP